MRSHSATDERPPGFAAEGRLASGQRSPTWAREWRSTRLSSGMRQSFWPNQSTGSADWAAQAKLIMSFADSRQPMNSL